MEVLVVSQREVPALLPMAECMDAMAQALAALARGEAIMPLRTVVWMPDRTGAMASMPSIIPSERTMAIKVITVFPGNLGTEFDSHQGAVLLFESEQGRLLAVIDATEITAIRTAAVSGVATRLLAKADAGDLAILGSGTQARTHLEAMALVRPLRRVRVWSRNRDHAEGFADEGRRRHGIVVEVAGSAREAVEEADVVCTTTSSPLPILQGQWLAPGCHVNAIGAVGPVNRELDTDAIVRARLFVDRRESAVNEAGEFVQSRDEGAIGEDHIAGELGELVAGEVDGRRSDDEITVFRGVGLAVEDLAAARTIHARAVATGSGTRVELGGTRARR